MRKTAEEAEEERVASKEQRKRETKDLRREEKFKKRAINIEICSEIVDLIMDVCDEANEQDELDKPKWREWMEVFTEGKKVSEINLVIQEDEGNSMKDSMAQLLKGSSTTMDPSKILLEAKSEPIYEEFMQYIAMSGPLNLRLIAPEQWHKLA